MAELQHPLKREIDKISAQINELHQLYNTYFQGIERTPPLQKRKELDEKIAWIRTEVIKKNVAAVSFLMRQLDARYQMMKNRWDKTMSEIESGAYLIPPKRK